MYSAVATSEEVEGVSASPSSSPKGFLRSSDAARRVTLVTLLFGALVGSAFLVVINFSKDDVVDMVGGLESTSAAIMSETAKEKLVVSNAYERVSGRRIGNGIYPHEHLVAVMKPTLLAFASGLEADWYMRSAEDSDFTQIAAAATTANFIFSDVGTTKIRAVRKADATPFDFDVEARIVRYEIRDLSDEDRELYLAALQTFYATSDEEGLKKYGSKFRSLEYLVRQHLYGAADKACDHWHDDAGILTHHVGITWEMEQSLRLIDSSTAAHYWDYTREDAQELNEDGELRFWWQSAIFRDEWFGSSSPRNGDHILDSGRWAYTRVKGRARDFSLTTNPYGLLRSPWNTNPIPFLMRYNHTFGKFGDSQLTGFPECNQGFVSYMNKSLAEVLQGVNGELHGPVHIMIGGHWNMRSAWDAVDAPGDVHLLLSKFMWRQGFVRVPEFCSDDTPGDDCMPSCPEEIRSQFGSAKELLHKAGVVTPATWSGLMQESVFNTTLGFRDLLEELCHVGYAGEMFTSSAPQDPLFWPLHGNAERFVQALRWYKENGFISGFDQAWGYQHVASASDTNIVCDWSEVSTFMDMPKCSKGTCPGHKAEDLLPFTDLEWADGKTSGILSNIEMYNRIGPENMAMPYVYDSVTYWEGCKEESLYVSAVRQGILPKIWGKGEAPDITKQSIDGVMGVSS